MKRSAKVAIVQGASAPGALQGKENYKARRKDSVSTRFKNVFRYCVLHCCLMFYLRLMKQQLLLYLVFCDIQNYQGLGKCYQPKMKAEDITKNRIQFNCL